MNFASDNTAGAHPRVLEAIAAVNDGVARSYGADRWSEELNEALSIWFDRAVQVFPVATGGAANALALSQLTPPWGAVFCHRESHINVDECGAPEFYSGGAKLVALDGPAGKLASAPLRQALLNHPRGEVHRMQPGAVSITQATECGTIYTPHEVGALAQVAAEAGIPLHMDGARLSNALVTLGCKPADITWKAGVAALSLGFTKNGAIASEGVVFFDAELAEHFAFRRKRGGHLFSKMRFFAAQMLAMLEDDLWRDLAGAANAGARQLAQIFAEAGCTLAFDVEANEVFAHLPRAVADGLRQDGAYFYPWGAESGEAPLYRFVCSFATREAEINRFRDRLHFHRSRN
ncbi:MAG: low specificity L-threonine aldolase [Alphaproteobacteria bacterium]|nr:low specificity L-threonine aldolase [Alphaproteobacteria bacterium]